MCVLELMNGRVLQTLREQLKVRGSRLKGSELLTSDFLRLEVQPPPPSPLGKLTEWQSYQKKQKPHKGKSERGGGLQYPEGRTRTSGERNAVWQLGFGRDALAVFPTGFTMSRPPATQV